MDLTVAHSASSLKPGAAPIILLKSEIGVPQLAKKLNQDWSENRKSLLPLPPVVKHFSHRDALFIDILIARLFSSLLSSPFLVSVLAQSDFAGSEDTSKGKTLEEGCHININLLTFTEVIRKLSDPDLVSFVQSPSSNLVSTQGFFVSAESSNGFFNGGKICSIGVFELLLVGYECRARAFHDEDSPYNRLYLVLLDNDRAKMLAKVPDEMKSYVENRVRVGHLICLKDFKVEPAYQKYMTFAKCKIVERDFQIVFDKDSTILPLCQSICNFPLYPIVSSIETIYGIQHGNHLIDVVGRVCYGHKVEYLNSNGGYRVPALEIYLLDMTCNVIALVLIGLPLTNHVRLVRACHDKSIIFVTRVKVILHTPLNYL